VGGIRHLKVPKGLFTGCLVPGWGFLKRRETGTVANQRESLERAVVGVPPLEIGTEAKRRFFELQKFRA